MLLTPPQKQKLSAESGQRWPLPDIVSPRGFIAYCNVLHDITSYCTTPPSFEVFLRCLEVFCFVFWGSDFGWIEVVSEKITVVDAEKEHYCTLLCNTPLPATLHCLQCCAIYFPHDPLYCSIQYWQYQYTLLCKGREQRQRRGRGARVRLGLGVKG